MDQLYKDINRTLESIRSAAIGKQPASVIIELVDKAISMNKKLEQRVYVLEMERANQGLDVSEDQLIVHPLHLNSKKS